MIGIVIAKWPGSDGIVPEQSVSEVSVTVADCENSPRRYSPAPVKSEIRLKQCHYASSTDLPLLSSLIPEILNAPRGGMTDQCAGLRWVAFRRSPSIPV